MSDRKYYEVAIRSTIRQKFGPRPAVRFAGWDGDSVVVTTPNRAERFIGPPQAVLAGLREVPPAENIAAEALRNQAGVRAEFYQRTL